MRMEEGVGGLVVMFLHNQDRIVQVVLCYLFIAVKQKSEFVANRQ